MLDHLKQEREAENVARERSRLAIFVAGLLLFGGGIVYATKMSADPKKPAGSSAADESSTGIPNVKRTVVRATPKDEVEDPADAVVFDAPTLVAAVKKDAAAPYRWSLGGFEYLETIRRTGRFPADFDEVTAQALASDFKEGRAVEIEGRVIERAQESYTPEGLNLQQALLWSLLVDDPRGGTFVVLSRGDAQGAHGGAPTALAPGHVTRPIEVGDFILVRGIALQLRVGTIGETVVREPTPAIYRTAVRRDVPLDERAEPIASPVDADWEEVRDLTLAETQRWDENVLYQLMQWARERGPEQLRKDIEGGALPWTEWGRDMFEKQWRPEVDPKEGQARTFTEGARGKLFRLDGIVAESLNVGWDVVPPNSWRVHDFGLLTLLADDYRQVAVRFFSPFELSKFKGVTGRRKDHVRVYGIFVKNHTYRTRYKNPGTDEYRFLTVPQFVLIAAESHPGASSTALTAMYWIGGVMALLALLFYFVLVRSGRRQEAATQQQRQRRRRKRAGLPESSTKGEVG